MTFKTLEKIAQSENVQITYREYKGWINVMFLGDLAIAYNTIDDNGNFILECNLDNFPKSCTSKYIKDCLGAKKSDLGEIKKINWQYFRDKTFVVADIETTGYSPNMGGRIIEIGAIKIDENGNKLDTFHEYINPCLKIPSKITDLTNITDDMVKDAPTIGVVLRQFAQFIKGSTVVFHNANFDWNTYLIPEFDRIGIKIPSNWPCIDTLALAKHYFPDAKKNDLATICQKLNIEVVNHHQAFSDVEMTVQFFMFFKNAFKDKYEHLPYTKWNFEKKEYNFEIIKTSKFEVIKPRKLEYEQLRVYVTFKCNGERGTAFYNFLTKTWGMKNCSLSIDANLLEEPTLKYLGVSTCEEMLDVIE